MASKKPRNKKYNPNKSKNKMPQQEFELSSHHFGVIQKLQGNIQMAQEAQLHFLTHLASNEWGYREGLELGFAIDWDKGTVLVDIQRDLRQEVKKRKQNDNMKTVTKKEGDSSNGKQESQD